MDVVYEYGWGLLRLVVVALLVVKVAPAVVYRMYRLFLYPYFVSPLRYLPGPKDHHFLIGHTLKQFRSGSPNEPYLSWMRRWPEVPLIRYFDLGNSDAVLVTSLAAYKEILHDKVYSFQKPPFFTNLVADIIGLGVVFAEGEEHKKQRRALAGLFSTRNLKAMIPMLQSKARTLTQLLDQIIETENGVVELVSLYSKIMLDIMGNFALGVELGNLKPGSGATNTTFDKCYHEVFEPKGLGQILVALNGIFPVRWLPLEANRRFVQANKIVRSQLTEIMQDRIRTVGERKTAGMDGMPAGEVQDVLTYLVTEKYYSNDDRWTEEQILNQILTFLAAGHETTAGGLMWATILMTQYPAETEKLRAEVKSLLNSSSSSSPLSQSAIDSLPYLENFIREVLRFQCPAINIAREAAKDVTVQGIHLRKGTTVLIQPAVFQHNPTIWGPDCDEFRPERFNHLEGQAADPYAYTAFSQGARICIGKAMTMLEFKIILIELVSRFEFEAVDKVGEMKLVNPSTLLRPEGGIRVRVRRLT